MIHRYLSHLTSFLSVVADRAEEYRAGSTIPERSCMAREWSCRGSRHGRFCGLHFGHPNLRRFFLTPLRFVSIRDSAVCQLTTNFDLKVMLPWQAFCPYASLSFTVRSLTIFVNLLIAFRSSESPQISRPSVRFVNIHDSAVCQLGTKFHYN